MQIEEVLILDKSDLKNGSDKFNTIFNIKHTAMRNISTHQLVLYRNEFHEYSVIKNRYGETTYEINRNNTKKNKIYHERYIAAEKFILELYKLNLWGRLFLKPKIKRFLKSNIKRYGF